MSWPHKIKAVQNQGGMASIIAVGILSLILILISVGFARLVVRNLDRSLNRELTLSATYAAQSGINDTISYLQNVDNNATSTNCDDLSGPGKPLYNDSNLSQDANRTVSYECVLLSQKTTSLLYQNLPAYSSQVVRMTTDNPVNSLMISWQSSNSSYTNLPSGSNNTLFDENIWNTQKYAPMLEVTLSPINATNLQSSADVYTRTIYLYPSNCGGSGTITTTGFPFTTGTLQCVNCPAKGIPAGFSSAASVNYECNVIVTGLNSLPIGINYYFAKIMPIYGQTNVEIQGSDAGSKLVNFEGVQATVDVTGKANTATKRLQARVDISNLNGGVDYNVSPNDNAIPDFALRSAKSICKRLNIQPGVSTIIDSSNCSY